MSPVNRNAAPFVLRPYQEHAVNAIEAAWNGERRPSGTGTVNRVATVAATGLGKTVVFSELIRRAHDRGERSIVLVHREELADQAMRKVHSMLPGASVGLVKAERDEWDADVVVASVPTLGRSAKRRERIPRDRFGIGIADECHHAAADTWQRTMHHFGAFDGRPWAGFTATMSRGDDRQLGETWSEVVAEYDISFGIRNKFLVPVSGKRIRVKNLLLDQVKRSRGDYQDADLGEAMEDADAGNTIADAYLKHADGRRAAMFSPTKSTARRFADDLNERGIPTEVVLGETTTEERTAIYERFRLGTTKVISSCMVITEGWDAPWAEVAVMARPTSSNALYIQCIGRVLRPFPAGGKQSALVLDVVGASERNRLVSLVELHDLKDIAPYDAFPDGGDDPDDVVGLGQLDDGPRYIEGEIVASEIELFDTSDSAWLRTNAGVWFVPTKTAYFYLWPKKDGSFGLGRKPVGGPQRKHGVVLENNLTLEGGMAWAERYALDEEDGIASISDRHANWRRKRPSEALRRAASAFHLPIDGLNQGQVGDLLTVAKASLSLPIPAN
jgi:superfamily II DNA or RNA helicase